MTDELVELIVAHVRQLDEEQHLGLPAELNEATTLFGAHGVLDSLALVGLVVTLEQALEDRFGIAVSLADVRAMSQHHSPFLTIGSFAQHTGRLVAESRQR